MGISMIAKRMVLKACVLKPVCMLRYGMVLLAVAILSQPVHAGPMVLNVVEDPGNLQNVPAMANNMDGALMAGARVQVGTWGGIFENVHWVADGPNSGHAAGNVIANWRLSLGGNSWGTALFLEGLAGLNGIDYVTIDLMPDHQIAAFDDMSPDPGTPGTQGGSEPWDGLTGSNSALGWDIEVFYKDAVAVGNNSPEHDIYRSLHIRFSQPFVAGDYLYFLADSDAVIPEPATGALLSLGLLALLRRNKRV